MTARRDVIKLAGAALAAQVLKPGKALAAAPRGPQPQGYNILFVLTDQERHFPSWPFPVPARERLARRGVSFRNHQIAASVCTASRSTIYTGRHIQHTGMFDNSGFPWQRDMSTDIRTIGHMLKDIGYHTAYFGKWHLSETLHINNTLYDTPGAAYDQTMQAYGFDDFFGPGDMTGTGLGGYRYDGLTAANAITWMRTRGEELRGANRNWFLAVNLINPHDVMYVDTDPETMLPRDYKSLIRPRRIPRDPLYQARWDQVPLPASRHQPLDAPGRPAAHRTFGAAHTNLLGEFEFSDERLRVLQNYYFNCIRDSDRHLERILDELDAQGLTDRTIIVFTSDHGEYGGAHQMVDKGGSAYREQNNVPLIISHPALEQGKDCQALTSHVDLVPTLLSLAGIAGNDLAKVAGPLVKGVDLSPCLKAPAAAPVNAVRQTALFNYAMLLYYDADWMKAEISIQRGGKVAKENMLSELEKHQPNLGFRGAVRSVFDGRYRFSRYFAYADFNTPLTVKELFARNDVELFDLASDPDEMTNLAFKPSRHRSLIAEMNRKLNEAIRAEVGEDRLDMLPIREGRVLLHVD